jgi:hypothetical protein
MNRNGNNQAIPVIDPSPSAIRSLKARPVSGLVVCFAVYNLPMLLTQWHTYKPNPPTVAGAASV